jgi:hypothetical protein
VAPLLLAVCLAAVAPPAAEPAYASKSPRYALLTFGPHAAGRIWIALDGDTLHVDRNGNGDLTELGERVRRFSLVGTGPAAQSWFDVGDVTAGGVTYPRVSVMTQLVSDAGQPGYVECHVYAGATACQHAAFRMSATPQAAPVIPIDSSLTLTLTREPTATPGTECAFSVRVGTRGRGTFASLYCQPPQPSAGAPPQSPRQIPAGLNPVAVFEFPCQSAGCPPIRVEATITARCCGDEFLGTVQVPEEAGPGRAIVTLSFPAWKAGHVTPATAEIVVGEGK